MDKLTYPRKTGLDGIMGKEELIQLVRHNHNLSLGSTTSISEPSTPPDFKLTNKYTNNHNSLSSTSSASSFHNIQMEDKHNNSINNNPNHNQNHNQNHNHNHNHNNNHHNNNINSNTSNGNNNANLNLFNHKYSLSYNGPLKMTLEEGNHNNGSRSHLPSHSAGSFAHFSSSLIASADLLSNDLSGLQLNDHSNDNSSLMDSGFPPSPAGPRFVFEEKHYTTNNNSTSITPPPSQITPIHQRTPSYLQVETTNDRFPILIRRESSSNTTSSSNTATATNNNGGGHSSKRSFSGNMAELFESPLPPSLFVSTDANWSHKRSISNGIVGGTIRLAETYGADEI